jgi:WD40 domain-containing protein
MPNNQETSARSKGVIVGVTVGIAVCLVLTFWPYKKSVPGETDIVTVAFSADGKELLGGTRGGEAYLWNLGTGQMLGSGHTLKSSKEDVPTPFNALALAPNGEFVLNAGRILSLIDTGSDKAPPVIWAPDCAFGGAAIGYDGSHISAISSEERLLVWTLRISDKPRDLGQADAGVYGATAFSPDGRRIASAGHVLRMVDVESGSELWARARDNYVFLTVAFRSDGQTIATGSQDTSIRLWNAETGKEIAILHGHQGYVDAVAFSPDGEKIVSWARDGQLFLWDLSVAKPRHRSLGKTKGGAAFSPDGRWVASGGPSKLVQLWDASNGEKARELSADDGPVRTTGGSADKKH